MKNNNEKIYMKSEKIMHDVCNMLNYDLIIIYADLCEKKKQDEYIKSEKKIYDDFPLDLNSAYSKHYIF